MLYKYHSFLSFLFFLGLKKSGFLRIRQKLQSRTIIWKTLKYQNLHNTHLTAFFKKKIWFTNSFQTKIIKQFFNWTKNSSTLRELENLFAITLFYYRELLKNLEKLKISLTKIAMNISFDFQLTTNYHQITLKWTNFVIIFRQCP